MRDSRASRSHARIIEDCGEFFVEDLNSSHGVWVNAAKVKRHKLRNGDRIEFGFPDSYSLLFTHEGDALHKLLDRVTATQPGNTDLTKLKSLVEVARALHNSLSLPEVLAAVVDSALAITGLERGFLLQQKEGTLWVEVGRGRTGVTLEASALETPVEAIQKALRQRRELLTMSFDPESEEFRPGATLYGGQFKSVVCVPLVRVRPASTQETVMLQSLGETVGVLYLDSCDQKADLSSGNRELLQTLALEASTILENARLLEEERVKQRIEEELKIAREIQTSLLPRSLPSAGWFRAAGSSVPSHQVGGDCYEVRQTGGDCWSVIVSDVSGKGVSSALLAALIQGAFLLASEDAPDIRETLQRVNHFLFERTQGEKYATIFYCRLHRNGVLHYANAGHCRPYVVRRDRTLETLDTTGSPVGMLPEAVIESAEVRLAIGDKLVVFSDGLPEAQNNQGQYFGARRIRTILRDHAMSDCATLHAALIDAVESFAAGSPQSDDMTAIVIEYSE